MLALARLTTGYLSISTTSTWVAPHNRCVQAARSSYPRHWLPRCHAQPSATIGGDSTSAAAGSGVGAERTAKPPLKVRQKGGGYVLALDV